MISQDWKKSFDSLFSEHTGHPEDALEDKREFVLEVARRGLLRTDLLRTYWSLYVASSTDVFLPLCLGARKIYLMDPCYRDPEKALGVDKAVQRVFGVTPAYELSGAIRFPFDFGKGQEEVLVKTVYAAHPEPTVTEELLAKLHDDQVFTVVGNRFCGAIHGKFYAPRWEPPEPLALLLGFSAFMLRLESDPAVMGKVVPGGCIFNTTRFEGLNSLDEAEIAKGYDWKAYTAAMPAVYAAEGTYEFIPLDRDCFRYTFLRRL